MYIPGPFPLSESMLCYFVAMLSFQGLAVQSIKTYVSAVKHENVAQGSPDLTHTPHLRQVMLGVSRLQPKLRRSAPRPCLPITVHLLRGLFKHWSLAKGQPLRYSVLRAAASVCFFGFFRSGEITVPLLTAFDPSCHLSWGDVALDEGEPPSCMKIHLKQSKCDQMGRGVDVYLGMTGDEMCPVCSIASYVGFRGTGPGPFFLVGDAAPRAVPLTKPEFVAAVREGLRAMGMNEQLYAGHSFRIGAATTAAQMGLEDSPLGRWTSAAFLSYVRTPPGQFISVARRPIGSSTH